jgi:hypothetical protein
MGAGSNRAAIATNSAKGETSAMAGNYEKQNGKIKDFMGQTSTLVNHPRFRGMVMT